MAGMRARYARITDSARRILRRGSASAAVRPGPWLSVGDEQHFGRAATRLALSQPSLSVQIKQLEAHIGARIFDRHSRRVRFTDAGRVMGVSYQSRQQYVLELSSTGR